MQGTSDDPLVPIGYIQKAHGIRGELALALNAEDLGLLQGQIFLAPPQGPATPSASPAGPFPSPKKPASTAKAYTVERVRSHHGSVLLSLENVRTRNEAELLRQSVVLVPKSKLPPLEEDEVYLLDLPGLRVLIAGEGNGGEREIGVISSVDIPSGQELWTITTPDGQEILFPAVEDFVLEIDLDAGVARIAPPEGLLDLYLEKR